jgi:SAM-dependent methyltransferase
MPSRRPADPAPDRAVEPPAMMADEKIRVMGRVEDEHWWFRAKRELVADVLGRAGVTGPVIDVGCGTGAVLDRLREAGHSPVLGTDLSPIAAQAARGRGLSVVRSVAEHLPFPTAAAAAVVSLDVIEHLDDDVAALLEYRRVVRADGLVVIAVPAYDWAWSDHDVSLGHRRRYTRKRLAAAAEAAGLDVVALSHFHSWLAPVAYTVRKTPLRRLLKGDEEEASLGRPFVNRALDRLAALERSVSRHRPIPVGLSILLVGRPQDPSGRR